MAELDNCSAMNSSSSTFLEQPMLDPEGRRQESSSALQHPICFGPEGGRELLHSGKFRSPTLPFNQAKSEELQLDATFSRLPAGTTSSTITTNVGDFAPQSSMPISCPMNETLPVQCSIIGQPPSPVYQQVVASAIYSNATLVSCGASAVPRNQTSDPLRVKGLTLAEALFELHRERQKNADLIKRVSSLEARLEEKDKVIAEGGEQISGASQGSLLKQNKQCEKNDEKVANEDQDIQNNNLKGVVIKQEGGAQILVHNVNDSYSRHGSGVTWMSREVKLPDLERPARRDGDSERDEFVVSDCTDDDYSSSEEEDLADTLNVQKIPMKETEGRKTKSETEAHVSMGGQQNNLDSNLRFFDAQSLDKGDHIIAPIGEVELKKRKMKRRKRKRDRKKVDPLDGNLPCSEMVSYKVHSMMAPYKKAPKIAFCPKEVKRIMESGVLALKNAQSHTMRKIIVFASLAICHGCEDLYELDFNHFSIIRRGDPYASPKDPGEHVLYDQPGFRRRIFYPNKQNPVLCPVCILDEERTMRPIGPNCPSCLFLCIKYGGRTRNLPQNEYVRQRMGRNKLKSFGTLMCQMALLVHIRSGSFFFKALGITLLFMAGFPDDMVCKETKYRTLDLLQKYYRSDEDAEGDVLFHPFPPFYPQAMVTSSPVPTKVAAARKKAVGTKQPPLLSKPPGSHMVASFYLPPITAWPFQVAPFASPSLPSIAGMGSSSLPPVTSPSTGMPCAVTAGTTVNVAVTSGAISPMSPSLYGNIPAYPVQSPSTGGFTPMSVWPPMNSFSIGPFPSPSYGYHQQGFTHVTHHGSTSCYANPFIPFRTTGTKNVSDNPENQVDSSNSDSESRSSGARKNIARKNIEKDMSSDSNSV